MSEELLPRRLAAILHADVVGYSRLMGDDEEATLRTLTRHRKVMADRIHRNNGRVVDMAGDSLLAEFPSVVEALRSAAGIQWEMGRLNAKLSKDRQLRFRIGINLGDVIVKKNAIYGNGINVAARIQALAEPGGICISGSVFDAVGDRLPFDYEYLGEQAVKNIQQPIKVFRAHLRSDADVSLVTAPRRRMALLSRWTWAGASAIVLVLAAGSLLLFTGEEPSSIHATSDEARITDEEVIGERVKAVDDTITKSNEPPSLAVLPFSNFSDDKGQEYFAAGMTEDLITDLSKLSGLLVIARTSVFQYQGVSKDVREIGNELNVHYILEGSVRRIDDKVRINAQLVDAETGNHLWADRYDGNIDNIFELQDQIMEQIITALEVKLTEGEIKNLERPLTLKPEAYEYFLRGREKFFQLSRENNPLARNLFIEATRLDPDFALAYGMQGWTHLFDQMNGWSETPEESLKKALGLANQALEIDPDLPLGYFVRGLAYRNLGNWNSALSSLEKAIAVEPNYANAHVLLSSLLYYAGRPEEGLSRIQHAIRLEPHHPYNYTFHLGQAYFILGRYQEAISTFQKTLEKNSAAERAKVWLAASYAQAGNLDDAEWEAEEVLINNPEFSPERFLLAFPFKNQNDRDNLVDGLHKAGFQ